MDAVHTAGWQITQLRGGELEVLLLPVAPVDQVEETLVARDITDALTEQGLLPPPAQAERPCTDTPQGYMVLGVERRRPR